MMTLTKMLLAATAAAVASSAPLAAKDSTKPVGTISISETQFGFLIGGKLGGGTLRFKGKSYPFKIGGISVGDLGVSKVRGSGHVYDMTSVSQFPGTYTLLDASATAGSGSGTLRMKNGDGVILEIDSKSKGLQLSAGAGGVKVTMK